MEIPKGYTLQPPEGYEYPKVDPMVQAMRDGVGHFPLVEKSMEDEGRETVSKNAPPALVSYWALYFPMRDFVINKIKAPLRKAIESAKTLKDISGELFSAIKKIPLITKKNTSFTNSHILIDKKELFLKYHTNPGRQKLLESVLDIDRFEYEHDGYYAFLQDWIIIELAMELAKGNWVPRFSKFPINGCWTGPDLPDIDTIRKQLREALNEQ